MLLSIVLASQPFMLFSIYDVAICAIFQDEAPFLKEWIEFHKLQGVQHFYLYNNNSTDHYLEVLTPYISSNKVTLVEWSFSYEYAEYEKWQEIQTGAYMNCMKKHQKDAKWIAVIDIDEFLFCPDGKTLPEFLQSYTNYGGVCVNWLKFGTSGIEDIPEATCMIELLIHCSEQHHYDNLMVKSIVQPKRVVSCGHAHSFNYIKPYFAVTPDRRRINEARTKINDISKICINHYWTRTEKYLFSNKIQSRQKRRPQFTTDKIMQMAIDYNQCVNNVILRYVDELRIAMEFETAKLSK